MDLPKAVVEASSTAVQIRQTLQKKGAGDFSHGTVRLEVRNAHWRSIGGVPLPAGSHLFWGDRALEIIPKGRLVEGWHLVSSTGADQRLMPIRPLSLCIAAEFVPIARAVSIILGTPDAECVL